MSRGLGFFLAFALSAASILAQTPAGSSSLSQDEAFGILRDMNEKEELFPEALMGTKGKYLGLAAENCFGLEPTKGWKLVGESSGKNYGISMHYAGDPSDTLQIGFLYSSSAFVLAGKPIGAGIYAVLANIETFQLSGDAGTYHWSGNHQVPDITTTEIKLATKLDESLFGAKSREHPRFSLVQEGKQTLMVIGDNKLPIRREAARPAKSAPAHPRPGTGKPHD